MSTEHVSPQWGDAIWAALAERYQEHDMLRDHHGQIHVARCVHAMLRAALPHLVEAVIADEFFTDTWLMTAPDLRAAAARLAKGES